MAPGSPVWQYALAAAGSGAIAMGFRTLAERGPRLKLVIDFVMFTGLVWIFAAAGVLIYFATKGEVELDLPMMVMLPALIPATIIAVPIAILRNLKLFRAKPAAPGCSPTPSLPAARPYEPRKLTARRYRGV